MIRKESLQNMWMKSFPYMVVIDHGVTYFTHGGLSFHLVEYFEKLYVNAMFDKESIYCKANITLTDLQSKYFLDILNPSDNELVLFELEYGFEFPFQEKNKKISYKEQYK